jgi:hypothetical protein
LIGHLAREEVQFQLIGSLGFTYQERTAALRRVDALPLAPAKYRKKVAAFVPRGVREQRNRHVGILEPMAHCGVQFP